MPGSSGENVQEWRTQALEAVLRLRRAGEATQHAIVLGDVAALPDLVHEEATLAAQLVALLNQQPPSCSGQDREEDGVAQLREQAQAWRRLHEQNQMLLEHAHRTVVEMLALLIGAGQAPSGLYSPRANGAGVPQGAAAGPELVPVAVDRRV